MRRLVAVSAVLAIAAVLLASFFLFNSGLFAGNSINEPTQPLPDASVYIGVTYCGENVTEAKMLIDKVKNYTNLFILQSGNLQKNIDATNTICRYAVDNGLHIIVYFSAVPTYRQYINEFLSTSNVWGNNLLGIYFDDEPGGKMLDAIDVNMYNPETHSIIRKAQAIEVTEENGTHLFFANDGYVHVRTANTSISYNTDGTIQIKLGDQNSSGHLEYTDYIIQPDGAVFQLDNDGNIASQLNDTSILPKIDSYEQIMAAKPFQNYDETAQIFVGTIQNSTSWLHSQTTSKAFTSDYALYWYDYKGGYDVVFAELGWNHTTTQDIALSRGAASMQSKDWGAIITWKYTYPERINFPNGQYGPYLGSGEEIYNQLHQAYEAGAKYLVVFNYPTYPANNPYGTLQEEHFEALQKLWTDTINNQSVVNGGIEAEAALVLPQNYGWGMRNPQDNIWGLWQADTTSPQVWNSLQSALATYGMHLDIVYNDSSYPVAGKYGKIIYATD